MVQVSEVLHVGLNSCNKLEGKADRGNIFKQISY